MNDQISTLAISSWVAGSVFSNPAWWRDREQGNALAATDLSPFFANVDFSELARRVTDNMRGKPDGVDGALRQATRGVALDAGPKHHDGRRR